MHRSITVLAVLVTTVGCTDSDRLATYKTTGAVTYTDGTKIQEGTVLCIAEGLPPARGIIEDGEFRLGTYEQSDGAVAAKFKVAVTVAPPIDYDPDDGKKPPVGAKAKYNRPETSGLEIEVKPDVENHFEIVLERGR